MRHGRGNDVQGAAAERRGGPWLFLARVAAAAVAFAAAGCATQGHGPARPFTFYPPPPEPPRFQYLTSISSPADVQPPPSALSTFLFGPPPAPLGIAKPYGLALKNGKLYVSDTATATIHIADLRKHTWSYLRPDGAGRLRKNIGVAVDDAGTLFVSDTVRGQVVMFDAEQHHVGVLGEPGSMKPAGMDLAGDRLYVADMKGRRIAVYDVKTRALVQSIPGPGVTNDAERLFQPVSVAVATNGLVYVSDIGAFHIRVYDAAGKFVRTVSRHGDGVGEFVRNKGIAVDRANRLYAVDAGFNLVQLYDDQDRMLLYFGDPESGEQGRMDLPADIIVDYDHVDCFQSFAAPGFKIEFLVLVSNQFGGGKVGVYGFLKPKEAAGP